MSIMSSSQGRHRGEAGYLPLLRGALRGEPCKSGCLNHDAIEPRSNNTPQEHSEGETHWKYTASLQLGEGSSPVALWLGTIVDVASRGV